MWELNVLKISLTQHVSRGGEKKAAAVSLFEFIVLNVAISAVLERVTLRGKLQQSNPLNGFATKKFL